MSLFLLSTKFFIPRARPDIVPRPRLIEKLRSGLERPGSFTLLSGPAGSGKTTLLSEFVAGLKLPVAWVSLDEGDNDPIRFWTYLIAACQSILEGVGEGILELFSTSQPLPDDTVSTILINDLLSQDRPIVLVLDDYHVIQNPSIQASLLFLLDHPPPKLHVIMSTRTDPPWFLARFRARNLLNEIRAQDLRFNIEEAAEFLNRTMDLNLSVEDVAALEERTEGWAAGLQLAALSMQGCSDIPAFVKAFTGSHVYVAEYLVEEILQRQPEEVQAFLLQTSILKRMNAGLSEAVTDCQDGQAILQALYRANILVVPLDDEGQWFRYHHLFADLLQARLRQNLAADAIAALQLRAANWYKENGFVLEAVNHTLTAKDFESAASLVDQVGQTMIFAGRVNTLRDWLDSFPEATFQTHPRLVFYLFWIDILQGKVELSEQTTQDRVELLKALPSSPENDQLRGELMAVLCRAMALSGHTSRAIHLAREALEYLSERDLASRARANSAIAIANGLEGRTEEAMVAYKECLSQAVAADDYRSAAHTIMVMALIQCHYGQLHDAASSFQSIIDMGDRTRSTPTNSPGASNLFFPAGQGYIGLAGIHLEWNELETAVKYLKQGMALCHQGGLDGIFIGRNLMSRLCQAKGDREGALEYLQLPKQAFKRADDINVVVRQIQIRLAEGDIEGATLWSAPLLETLSNDSKASPIPLLFLEVVEAIVSQVYLAQGKTGKALQLLERLQATAEPGRRNARLIEVHLLRALVIQAQNHGNVTPETSESFEHALSLAEPEGYILIFLEKGAAVIPLLITIINNQASPGRIKQYARKILDAFRESDKSAPPRSAGEIASLVESLTPREMEVLRLLAAGDSNQAIADKLFITVRTVKKHAGNIYGKLNVSSRTQAVARARELGLLPTNR